MKTQYLFVLLPLVVLAVAADGPRGPAKRLNPGTNLVTVIDPDKSIYGVPFGTLREQFIQDNGEPTATVELSRDRRALIYGDSHAFLFKKGELVGVRIGSSIFDHRLDSPFAFWSTLPQERHFNTMKWELSNQIMKGALRNGMTFREVKKVLGLRLFRNEPFRPYLLTESARVEFDFTYPYPEAPTEDNQTLYGMMLIRYVPKSAKTKSESERRLNW